jgi:hypothetical protein
MTAALVESPRWSPRRWLAMVGLIFGVQLGLIFWLGDASPIRERAATPALTLKLAGNAAGELLAFNDPTLFARPHPQRVPAPAWLSTPRPEVRLFGWPEPTNYLLLSIDQLGAGFNRFVETNAFGSLPSPTMPLPELTIPEIPLQPAFAERSTVRVELDRAPRRLLTPLDLPSWESPDILTNSVVQIVVGADGTPVSVTLLSGSGSRAADEDALQQANAARFETLGQSPFATALNPAAQLDWGRMIFRWHTLPPASTNVPAVAP